MNTQKTDSEYQAEIDELKKQLKLVPLQPGISPSDCPHSNYWVSNYGNCVMCMVDTAEKERDALKSELKKQENDFISERCAYLDRLGKQADTEKALTAELASLRTVAKAASKGQSDFKNYYPERGYSTDASDYDSRAERLKKNIRDLDESLTNHTAKYKLE